LAGLRRGSSWLGQLDDLARAVSRHGSCRYLPYDSRRTSVARVFARSGRTRLKMGGARRGCEPGASRLQAEPILSRVRDAPPGGLEARAEPDRGDRPPGARGFTTAHVDGSGISRTARLLPPNRSTSDSHRAIGV